MPDIQMYVKQWCPYCSMAKRLLSEKGREWTEIDIEAHPELRSEMIERSGRRTVPQIFVGQEHVGGYDDLKALDDAGKLDHLLEG